MSPAKTAEPIEIPFGMWTRVSPKNHVVDGVQMSTREGTILRAKRSRSGHVRTCPAVGIFKVTQQGAELVQCGCRLGVPDSGAHWRHLTNTIERSVCGGDAALCQITLTAC